MVSPRSMPFPVIDPEQEHSFKLAMHGFLQSLTRSAVQQHQGVDLKSAYSPSGNLTENITMPECTNMADLRLERAISPGHSRSRLYLMSRPSSKSQSQSKTSNREFLVKKVHGSAASFQSEMAFYQRVPEHRCLSRAFCWSLLRDLPDHHKRVFDSSDLDTSTRSSSSPLVKRRGSRNEKALFLEWVQGGQSGDWLYEVGWRLGMAKSIDLFRGVVGQLLDVIEHIHLNGGMVHGDIKPENILVSDFQFDQCPVVKVIDFDLSADKRSPRIRSGTRTTISPEVAGIVSGPLNDASDWWSVGATITLWLTAWQCGAWEGGHMKAHMAKTSKEYQFELVERICRYKPFLFVRPENRFIVNPLPKEMVMPKGLPALLVKLLQPEPEKRSFDGQVQDLRKSFGLKKDHPIPVIKATIPEPAQHKSLHIHYNSWHNSQEESSSDVCLEDDCVKAEQEPLFNRRQ